MCMRLFTFCIFWIANKLGCPGHYRITTRALGFYPTTGCSCRSFLSFSFFLPWLWKCVVIWLKVVLRLLLLTTLGSLSWQCQKKRKKLETTCRYQFTSLVLRYINFSFFNIPVFGISYEKNIQLQLVFTFHSVVSTERSCMLMSSPVKRKYRLSD